MTRNSVVLMFVALIASSCATVPHLPSTPGERASGFGYVPLDGLKILEYPDYNCDTVTVNGKRMKPASLPLLQALPDISVRFAVASSAADATLSFGPAKVTSEGGAYRAVLDYVNVDAISVRFRIRKFVKGVRKPLMSYDANENDVAFEALIDKGEASVFAMADTSFDVLTVPVYVGIGMRLSADIRAFKTGVSLTSLGAIAAAAQANALSGTLTVQTLGITGRPIATALPLPSKLDPTTVENGILALGSSRALIYGNDRNLDEIMITPRIVGLYSPIASNPRLINAIYSQLASSPQTWYRPCSIVKEFPSENPASADRTRNNAPHQVNAASRQTTRPPARRGGRGVVNKN